MRGERRAFKAEMLPVRNDLIDVSIFLDDLIDATVKLEVYKEKINDSKLDRAWFLPTLQQKEALASSMLEGTQATLDGVLVNQVIPDDKNYNLVEVMNYQHATEMGYRYLSRNQFSKEFILDMHRALMRGNVRCQTDEIGIFRTQQNYVGRIGGEHEITYTPPIPEDVPDLMDNLLVYMCDSKDNYRPLVRTAIIHAQFETIHPFMDGNGRVGRILIPLYLYAVNQIDMPCFFVSEALERDKMKYYTLLTNIREKGQWSEWIKFFLHTVTVQCDKYIRIISKINALYDEHYKKACALVRSNQMGEIVNLLYRYPIINTATIARETEIPPATINRYLNVLVKAEILYSDNKSRNRTYYYYDLLNIIRE